METVVTGIGNTMIAAESSDDTKSAQAMTQIWESLKIPNNLGQLLQANADIIAVSDGSFKDGHGTAAWVLMITEDTSITGKMITPGTSKIQSAYRSELAGLYGILCTITMLEQRFNHKASITIGCDGLSALQRVFVPLDCVDTNSLHYDLITACRSLWLKSSWKVHWHHVRGHQDDVRPASALTIWERLNVQMDHAAKAFLKETMGTESTPFIPGEPWRVVITGEKISSKLKEALRLACTSVEAAKYWEGKKRFGQGSATDVDWEAFGAALKQLPITRQHWISKTTSGFCAVGIMMFRRKEHPSPACPRCNEVETVEHVWKCKTNTDQLWTKSLSILREWMLQHDTHPVMADAIVNGLDTWRTDSTLSPISANEWINDVVAQQTKLGWRNFFEGMLSSDWQIAQQSYLSQIGSRRSSKRWVTSIIKKLWQIAWDIWEHRNGYLHARNTGLHSLYINEIIATEFNKEHSTLDRETRVLFCPGLEAITNKPLEVREQWIKRVQAARLKMETKIQTEFKAERSFMSAWLKGN
jgi:hypothetical protein